MNKIKLEIAFKLAQKHTKKSNLNLAIAAYKNIILDLKKIAASDFIIETDTEADLAQTLCCTLGNLANLYSDKDYTSTAIKLLRMAISTSKKLEAFYVKNWYTWAVFRGEFLGNLSAVYMQAGQTVKAKNACERAIGLLELVKAHWEIDEAEWMVEWECTLGSLFLTLANISASLGLTIQAKSEYESAIITIDSLLSIYKNEPNLTWLNEAQIILAKTYASFAITLLDLGEKDEAVSAIQQGITLKENTVSRADNNLIESAEPQIELAQFYSSFADILYEKGDLDSAIENYQKAINRHMMIKKCFDEGEFPRAWSETLSSIYNNLAKLYSSTTMLSKAKEYYEKALKIMDYNRDSITNREKWLITSQQAYALTINNLASVHLGLDEQHKTQSYYHTGIKLMENVRDSFNSSEGWPIAWQNDLSRAYFNLARLNLSIDNFFVAQDFYKKATSFDFLFTNNSVSNHSIILALLFRWSEYLLVAGTCVLNKFKVLANKSIHILDIYSDKESQDIGLQLLHRMVAFSLKNNEINLALKLIHCAQGRELAYKLEASQLTGNEPDVVTLFVKQRAHYRALLADLTQNPNRENDTHFLNELGKAKDVYSQSRTVVAALPEYAPLLSPLNIEVTDIQATQGKGQATLMWLSFTQDKEFPVNGVLAIPTKGEPQFFGLTDSFERLLTLHDDLTKLMSGRGYRKNAMSYSDADIQGVLERYADGAVVKSPQYVIKQVWHNITRAMQEVWQGESSPLSHWLIDHGIKEILNLTQGRTHNFPLSLGCNEAIKHRFIPGVALWRQRQALDLGQQDSESHHVTISNNTISSQTCAGKAIAIENEDIRFLIPHTVLEQHALYKQLDDGNDIRQATSLATQGTFTADTLFPHHDEPLSFAHIACHGVPDEDNAGGAKLVLDSRSITSDSLERMKSTVDVTFFNACIAGTTQDDTKGEHHGLLVPLLTKAHQVIASTLPLDDVKASYFAVLLFHYYWREGKVLSESVTLAKKALETGQWPALVKDIVINIYHQAVDELPEESVTSIIQPGYAAIPELCYCLQIFNFESLDIDLTYDVIQADMKTLITEQFGQGLIAHLQHSDEGRMRKEMLDIFINSIKVFR